MEMVSTPRVEFLRALRRSIDHSYGRGRVLVAVDGRPGSGSGSFADGLALAYGEIGRAAVRASLEDFHRPRAERYREGQRSTAGYYRDSYDDSTLRRVLIEPFRMAGSTGFQTRAFDVSRDAPVVSSWQTTDADAVLILDGVFLMRPSLRREWDYAIHLTLPIDLAYERLARDEGRDPDPYGQANERYTGGYLLYEEEADPDAFASAVVDVTDERVPVLIPGSRG